MDKGLLKIEELKTQLFKLDENLEKIKQEIQDIKEINHKISCLNLEKEKFKELRDELEETKLKKIAILELIGGIPFICSIIIMYIFLSLDISFTDNYFKFVVVYSVVTACSLVSSIIGLSDLKVYIHKKKDINWYLKNEETMEKDLELCIQKRNEMDLLYKLLDQKEIMENRKNIVEKKIQQIEQLRNDVISNYLNDNIELDNLINEKYDDLIEQKEKQYVYKNN